MLNFDISSTIALAVASKNESFVGRQAQRVFQRGFNCMACSLRLRNQCMLCLRGFLNTSIIAGQAQQYFNDVPKKIAWHLVLALGHAEF
jgi:hypothetical protein